MDRLNVRNILRRKRHKLQRNDYNCVLCSAQTEETTFHLFFSCPFSLQCWNHLKINWRFGQQFHSMMEEARLNFNSKFFMEIFILGCWQIWKQRNDFIFNRSNPSFLAWKLGFLEEANLQANRLRENKRLQLGQKTTVSNSHSIVQIECFSFLCVSCVHSSSLVYQ
jgi:hypothetical protein